MSKITNIRLPATGFQQDVSPVAFNQTLEAVTQIVRQLNSTYTPQATEDNQSELDWFSGFQGDKRYSALDDQDTPHGAFVDFTTQTHTSTNTAKAITWDTTADSHHVYVGSPTSRIYFQKGGLYQITFTAQVLSSNASAKNFWFWPRVNGTDVTGSTMRISLDINGATRTISRPGMFEMQAGDYLEAVWAVDDIATSLKSYAAESFCPAVPSVTLMVVGTEHG